MAHSTVHSTFFSSGSISFGALYDNFDQSGGKSNVRLSDYKRITAVTNSNPLVPDATENANIPSTNSNIALSGYRNSIKIYVIRQSNTDTTVNISGLSWNSNLGKNIKKYYEITGTLGTTNVNTYAGSFDATAYNMNIQVGGGGLRAAGGGTNSGSGGTALYARSSGSGATSAVVVNVVGTGVIYGGGGGGEQGTDGSAGSVGNCTDSTTTGGCGNAPGCPSGYSSQNVGQGGCCESTCGSPCWRCCEQCQKNNQTRYCIRQVGSTNPGGTTGGTGGAGRGYLQNSQGGSSGTSASCPQCPSGTVLQGGSCSQSAGMGGAGGQWGQAGQGTARPGSPGAAGRAIIGQNYAVTGSTSNILGLYGAAGSGF